MTHVESPASAVRARGHVPGRQWAWALLLSFLATGSVASISLSASPDASLVPVATPGPVSSSEQPGPAFPLCPPTGLVPAGTYYLPPEQSTALVPLTLTMTDGWNGCGLSTRGFDTPQTATIWGFWTVANVYADPCRWETGLFDPPAGLTVDDLAAALAGQALTDATAPADIILDGFPGKYLEMSVPVDVDVSGCDREVGGQEDEFRFFWDGVPGGAVWWVGAAHAPGLRAEVWMIDVAGARVVVQAAYGTEAPDAWQDEVHQIVESIHFEP